MKKVLAILLSLILIISIVPMGLFSITASAATGGKTGDCMWVKDGTVLTISGNGDMNDYTSSILPWGTSITEVIIEEGVTSIGDYAFNRCKSLTSITIPNSVTSIGMYAFEQCTTLKSITIPDSVTSIGYGAFSNCASLKSVNITDIAAWCKIKFGDNPLGSASAGELYLNGTLVTDLTIPDSVTSIGGSAFSNCTSLTSVTIPDSVTSIGGSAFYDCKSLTRVDFGDSVKSIGNYAFYNCTKLTSVNLPDSVKSIGEWAFYNCYKLTIITIPDSVTSIGKFAFYSCSNLESITLPFVGSSRNASGTADAVFGYIFGYTTSSSTGTTRQYYSSSSSYYYYIPSSIKSVTITDDPTIPYGAFYNCESLTNVNLPDSVTSIGEEAFYNCTGLTSITIPDSVKSIGGWAFDGCTSLKSVNITDIAAWCKIDFYFSTSNPLYYADELYLNGTLVTDLTIPDSVTSISEYAFFGYTKLTSVPFKYNSSA